MHYAIPICASGKFKNKPLFKWAFILLKKTKFKIKMMIKFLLINFNAIPKIRVTETSFQFCTYQIYFIINVHTKSVDSDLNAKNTKINYSWFFFSTDFHFNQNSWLKIGKKEGEEGEVEISSIDRVTFPIMKQINS